jgi:UDPglucose--hexose-1-phosphate uridylyltransferase
LLAVLPYHRQIQSILDLDDAEILAFAHVLSEVTKRYDALFGTSFPYSMGIHQRPVGGATKMQKEQDEYSQSHLHLHFYPPLLRSATVRKFLVGYEMMAESQRDLTAEQAAQRLRMCGSGLAEKVVTDIKS